MNKTGPIMRLAFIFLLLLLTSSCTKTTTDKEAIVNNRMASNLAIANHDVKALDAHWADDILVITSRNTKFTGKDQYTAGLEQDFRAKEEVVYIRTPDEVDVFPSWSVAAESGHWIGKWKADSASIEITGTYYAKWRKTSDQWLISAEIYTPLHCTGGSYCNDPP